MGGRSRWGSVGFVLWHNTREPSMDAHAPRPLRQQHTWVTLLEALYQITPASFFWDLASGIKTPSLPPPLSLLFSTSLSLSQGYFPVPREPLLFVWHFWKLPRALPSPTAGHAPAARDTAGDGARGDICICELNFWAGTSAAWIGEVKWI